MREGLTVAGNVHIGLSGWNYAEWKDGFYQGVPRKSWLPHYASRFSAVEVNATFYRQQRPETFAAWAAQTPPHFRFAVKGHKYATHMKRLIAPEETIPRHRDALSHLDGKLAVMLWQLPGNFKANPERLDRFCAVLRDTFPNTPQVMELRHETWFTDDTLDVLTTHGVATCISDAADWPRWDAVTSGLAYLRLHGGEETYFSSYTDDELRGWAKRIARWHADGMDVQVYFDNTAAQAAPADAPRLARLLAGKLDTA